MVGTQTDPRGRAAATVAAPGGGDSAAAAADVDEKPPGGGGRNCCKKVLKFVFSHVGLCGMVVAYAVVGGFIFEHLEQTNEKMECEKARDKYAPEQNHTANKLWQIAANFREDDGMEFALHEFQKVLTTFRQTVLDLGYDGRNCSAYGEPGGPQYKWSFPGAMLFSVTVITTIGYGHIAPKTYWGRQVCIAYALLGIPLMLLCLANIGDAMADMFRFIYTKICCCGWCRRKKPVDQAATSPGAARPAPASSTAAQPQTPEAWKEQFALHQAAATGGVSVVDDWEDDDDESDTSGEEAAIVIPLTITISVIAGYIFLGATIFAIWDGWTLTDASYFSFVTVSTIGFGDLVPGQFGAGGSDHSTGPLLAIMVYMLFGMAIISMAFSLIQEEIVSKFRWLGEKMGIIEHDGTKDTEESSTADSSGTSDVNNKQMFTPARASLPNDYSVNPDERNDQRVARVKRLNAAPLAAARDSPFRMKNTGANDVKGTGANDVKNAGANNVKGTGAKDVKNTGANNVKSTGANYVKNTEANDVKNTEANDVKNTEANDVKNTEANDVKGTGSNDVSVRQPKPSGVSQARVQLSKM